MNSPKSFKPYKPCIGRKYRKLPQLYRSLTILFETSVCNCVFNEKVKILFIKQLFRWFLKSTSAFKVEPILKYGKSCRIAEGDIIYLTCHSHKAAWKKLLSKLKIEIVDYSILKRRKYTLTFTFMFLNVMSNDKNITLDINCNKHEFYNVFITTSLFYVNDFMQMLAYYYITINPQR